MTIGLSEEAVNRTVRVLEDVMKLKPFVRLYTQVGSSVYLPNPNDVDYVVLVSGTPKDAQVAFIASGWEPCDKGQYTIPGADVLWTSVRLGDINLMLTGSLEWYENYILATRICEVLELPHKWQRIRVCRVVRDQWPPEAVLGLVEANPGEEDL